MSVLKFDVLGSPHIGNYGVVSNKYLITLEELGRKKLERMEAVFKVKTIGIRLINCRIIRPFFAGNSNGLLVSKIVEEDILNLLKKSLNEIRVEVLDTKYTAVGNLITANDKGCIVSPIFSKKEIKVIKDVLDVEISQIPISKVSYVGSLLRANNKGGLVTPYAEDDEIDEARRILGVRIHRGTVNSGIHFISAGILVNDYGLLVGELTDGIELMNMSETFGVT